MPTAVPGRHRRPHPGVLGTQRWKRLLPIVFITYSLAYLDRSNYSLAVAGGHGGGPARSPAASRR